MELSASVSRGDGVRFGALWVAVAVAGLAAPLFLGDYYLQLAVQGITMGILALAVGWLVRQVGLVSFGHAAYFGTAAYLMAIAATRWDLSPLVAVLVGVGGSALLAFLVGLLVVRAPGISFAMLTLAVGQAVYVLATRLRSVTGGFDGISVTLKGSFLGRDAALLTDPVTVWPVVWLGLMLAGGVLWWVSRSFFGRRLAAIRENEERARFSGHPTYLPRVLAFTISGAVAGLAGVLNVLSSGLATPDMLFWLTSGEALIVAIVGGVASLVGPPVGAVAFVFGRESLASSDAWQLILGVILIAVVVLAPGGAAAIAGRARALLPRRQLRRGSDARA